MGRKSSIARLPSEIRDAVERALRDRRATAAEIVSLVDSMGGKVSESAVLRFRRTFEESMKVTIAAQEMARVWGQRMEEEPGGDTARLATQVLGAVALNTAQAMTESGEPIPSGEVMFLGKALDHIARARKSMTEEELRIRRAVAAEAAEKAASVVKSRGLSAEAADEIRREILGIAA